jgi:hypothetical protein
LWLLSSKLFGAIDGAPLESVASAPGAEASPTPEATPVKRSRLGIFRRKKDDDTAASTPSAPGSGTSTPNLADSIANGVIENDKHGQVALFKAAMANSSPEELRDAFWQMVKHDHPDALLLRFLRARKWDVNAAQVMAISALHWRITEGKVDSDVMHTGELGMLEYSQSDDPALKKKGNDFMEQIRLGKSYVRGRDKEGRPCCYIRTHLHHAGDQSEESLERFTIHTIETARLMLHPPVDTAVS